MNIQFVKTKEEDLPKLIEIRNKCFKRDFETLGICPEYNLSLEQISQKFSKGEFFNIIVNDEIVGSLSYQNGPEDEIDLTCLCVLPKFENLGIGTQTLAFLEGVVDKGKTISLVTPIAKKKNIHFYEKNDYLKGETFTKENINYVKYIKYI